MFVFITIEDSNDNCNFFFARIGASKRGSNSKIRDFRGNDFEVFITALEFVKWSSCIRFTPTKNTTFITVIASITPTHF